MTYRLLEDARTDIAAILDYVGTHDQSAAQRLNRDLLKSFQTLGSSPMLGHRREDLTHRDLRFWPVRHWLVVHRSRDPVEIVAVIDGRCEVVRMLR